MESAKITFQNFPPNMEHVVRALAAKKKPNTAAASKAFSVAMIKAFKNELENIGYEFD
jgi:hypothetical protein